MGGVALRCPTRRPTERRRLRRSIAQRQQRHRSGQLILGRTRFQRDLRPVLRLLIPIGLHLRCLLQVARTLAQRKRIPFLSCSRRKRVVSAQYLHPLSKRNNGWLDVRSCLLFKIGVVARRLGSDTGAAASWRWG